MTSLPLHLNARFAISSNRIVFDSSKARDPKSDFNVWILTDIVPPPYLQASLALLVQQQAKQILPRKFWFLKSSDDISKHVGDAFLSILATSDHALFKSIDGSLLSFKNSVFWKGDESSKIVQVLTLLKVPRLVTSYVSSGLATIETARRVDATYARDVLGNISLKRIRLAYDDKTITFDNMLNLLLYIRQETPGPSPQCIIHKCSALHS